LLPLLLVGLLCGSLVLAGPPTSRHGANHCSNGSALTGITGYCTYGQATQGAPGCPVHALTSAC
jgi:hypothetical protein